MKFKELHLYSHQIAAEKRFYAETLGFPIVAESAEQVSFAVGWSILTFKKSETPHLYHYCFLIPSNKLQEALAWAEKRLHVIVLEDDGTKTVHFENWNADSFYFYDASGNIAEFIVRHELKNETEEAFDISSVLCVNEMGVGTKDIAQLNAQLERETSSKFWKGDTLRFGTNGSQEGLFLLPNYEVKEIWYPTEIRIKPEPFEAIIENEGENYAIVFKDEQFSITKI